MSLPGARLRGPRVRLRLRQRPGGVRGPAPGPPHAPPALRPLRGGLLRRRRLGVPVARGAPLRPREPGPDAAHVRRPAPPERPEGRARRGRALRQGARPRERAGERGALPAGLQARGRAEHEVHLRGRARVEREAGGPAEVRGEDDDGEGGGRQRDRGDGGRHREGDDDSERGDDGHDDEPSDGDGDDGGDEDHGEGWGGAVPGRCRGEAGQGGRELQAQGSVSLQRSRNIREGFRDVALYVCCLYSRNACPVKEEVVAPFWANNTRGELLALLNLYPYEQYVHWEKCSFEHRQMYCRDGCRYVEKISLKVRFV